MNTTLSLLLLLVPGQANANPTVPRIQNQEIKPGEEKSVRPGINDRFLEKRLDVKSWVARFEIESREVYAAREALVTLTSLKPGSTIADIGAGTGFFSRLFSREVGGKGLVYAVDIAPRFIAHIDRQARKEGLRNIQTVQCKDKSVNLPPKSIDVAFICDTYHHFEYPRSTIASIHRALRMNGMLVLVDFERIPGKSKAFTLNHVRAGKEVFRKEIEEGGFVLIDQQHVSPAQENYVLRFKKK
jgi:ubiquinone/menaquinone biosynthesis C-methylase UbiE